MHKKWLTQKGQLWYDIHVGRIKSARVFYIKKPEHYAPANLIQYYHEQRKDNQERKVKWGEQPNVVAGLSLVLFGIFAESDQAGKGGNQCANTADVYTQQKFPVVFGELGKENGRGNVADHLAGDNGKQQGAFFQQKGK